ncbi:MAG TPA: RNA polymerase sigma factor [Pirellulales bacterium]|nr:RNA polymerase sigma factor [Pirellulales bacterium]
MDTDSFARLIAPVKSRMFETVWRILRHRQDSEDALQNALTTVWRQRARIARHAAPQALMLKICADAAIDQFRRRRRRRDKQDISAVEVGLCSARPSPMDDAIGQETLEIIMEAISRLSPKQATAVVMRFIQGECDATIAAALGCGTETVREHLDRGRERLGRMLGRLAPHGRSLANTAKTHLPEENER